MRPEIVTEEDRLELSPNDSLHSITWDTPKVSTLEGREPFKVTDDQGEVCINIGEPSKTHNMGHFKLTRRVKDQLNQPMKMNQDTIIQMEGEEPKMSPSIKRMMLFGGFGLGVLGAGTLASYMLSE